MAGHFTDGYLQQSIRGNQYVKNYKFSYQFGPPLGHCEVTFTSVSGHVHKQDFTHRFSGWYNCDPGDLFDAPIVKTVDERNEAIAANIKTQARSCSLLYIWTDCDREGEHIGSEIRDVALAANSRLEVKRAHFSNIERAFVHNL
jgi:DNA topoisomerase-3